MVLLERPHRGLEKIAPPEPRLAVQYQDIAGDAAYPFAVAQEEIAPGRRAAAVGFGRTALRQEKIEPRGRSAIFSAARLPGKRGRAGRKSGGPAAGGSEAGERAGVRVQKQDLHAGLARQDGQRGARLRARLRGRQGQAVEFEQGQLQEGAPQHRRVGQGSRLAGEAGAAEKNGRRVAERRRPA